MQFKIYYWLPCFLAVSMLTGCATGMKNAHMTATGGLIDESMTVVARPVEYAMETVEDASGEAETEKFLFFTLSGDRPDITIPVTGAPVTDPLEHLACFRAVEKKGGDGFYKIKSEWDKTNILGLYRKKHVKVTGKVLKIKDLGIVPADRADEIRKYPRSGVNHYTQGKSKSALGWGLGIGAVLLLLVVL